IVKSPREMLHLGKPQDRTRSPIEGVDLTAIPLRVASPKPESHAKSDEKFLLAPHVTSGSTVEMLLMKHCKNE
ncbi:MAG TPA: hypothetical protein V6D14_10950, partial [Coleofasciculaceae cyanobacterium]